MTKQGLKYISDKLKDAGIPYAFMVWSKEVTYPYFVGEYTETEPLYEYGESETTFMITGTAKGSWLALENAKDTIRELFPEDGAGHIFVNGVGIAVMYSDSKPIPTNTDELKRIQINLKIKEWRVK